MRSLIWGAAALLSATLASAAGATTVATISGCYDCGVFDTPSLVFNNTTGGTLTDAKLVLTGYQADNNGLSATVSLPDLTGGSTQVFWGSLPGVPNGTTPGNLTAYDYDDEYIGTPYVINDPTCGGGGCAPGGGPQWYADVGNFNVVFTAKVSGGVYDGQSVYSVFSPSDNATGGFVGWEGLDPKGFSESPSYDVHDGSITGRLADIDLGVPPAAPEPGSWILMLAGVFGLGAVLRRRTASIAGLPAA